MRELLESFGVITRNTQHGWLAEFHGFSVGYFANERGAVRGLLSWLKSSIAVIERAMDETERPSDIGFDANGSPVEGPVSR